MKAPYADTNFLTALHCGGPHQAAAEALRNEAITSGRLPIPLTLLGRMELVNAFEQLVYLSARSVHDRFFTREMAMMQEAAVLEEMELGRIFRSRHIDETDLEQQVRALAHRHTAKHGFRAYDVIHVASALVLGCHTFWSFDLKAKHLAKMEGLEVN